MAVTVVVGVEMVVVAAEVVGMAMVAIVTVSVVGDMAVRVHK